jgi:hypothetical protein
LPNGVTDFLATGSAPLDAHGRPESGPSLHIDKRVGIDGTTQRVDIEGLGKSLTDFALDEATGMFEAAFGHSPETLPGSLIDDNRAIFQRAYLAEIDARTDPEVAKVKAAEKTPFGGARMRRGYKHLEVTIEKTAKMVIGDPPRLRDVPTEIKVTARRAP